MKICIRCGTQSDSTARYCARCGTATLNNGGAAGGANLRGGVAGMAGGSVVAIFLMAGGLVFCLTGIGALVGIPFILVGLVMPFVGGAKGLATRPVRRLVGQCPWCGSRVARCAPGFNCAACANRIIVRENVFSKAPTS
jgi:hypothetical protein